MAEVLVNAEASEAGKRAFPILAGYIFGKNKGERTFAMTAPVTQSESNYNEHLAKLQSGLRAADIAWDGEPVYSHYDGPMTPWFLRRNEIGLALALQ